MIVSTNNMPLKQKERHLLSNVRRARAQQEIVSDEMGMFNALLFLLFWNIVDKKLMTLMNSEE